MSEAGHVLHGEGAAYHQQMALSSILQSSVLLQFQGLTKIHIPWAMAESRKNMPVTVSMRGAHSDSTTSNV